MARVSIDRHIPVPVPVADPGRREVSFTFVLALTVTYPADEARRFGDQYMAALDRLNVAGAVEVDRG